MVDLIPAPNSLGLSSPALGPWFSHQNPAQALPNLPQPGGNLAVALTLAPNMQWLAPAICLRSLHFATTTRPQDLSNLRQESGAPAFTDGNLVILLTLLPEVELRLWALTQPIPTPDGTPPPSANTPSRPRIRYLAMEIPAAQAATMIDVENLRPSNFPIDLDTDEKKATFVGLTTGASLGNAPQATRELLKPTGNNTIALENRTLLPLSVNLWSFDYRGRAVDPGAVANWWTFMATVGIWDNLWADPALPVLTSAVTAGRIVQISSAHEGPVSAPLLTRLNLTDLTQIAGSTALYTAGAAPAVAITASPNPDNAPIPRIAALPLGNYADPATATPFAGWTGAAFPAGITRDFLRIGFLDIEQHVVGLTRADPVQADQRRRIAPARNTAATPVLFDSDAVHGAVMTTLNAGATATAMAPVMDLLWGQNTPPGDFGSEALPEALAYRILPLAGEGTTSVGGSSADQSIAVHFETGSLPANCWIRLWTHGLDTETGLRFRQDGGAARSDLSGQAFVVLAIPDGTAAPIDTDADPVRLSFDALVLANGQSRYFSEERYDRPATVAGNRLTLAAPPALPLGASLWLCEQGAAMNRAAGQYASGETLLVIPDDPAGVFSLVDLASLDPSDCAAPTLINAAGNGDTLVVTDPAFGQTPTGDLSAGPGGATFINHTRTALAAVSTMGHPAPSQERREVLALERTGNTAVTGATPGRAKNHEAPPMQLGHAGVPAQAEIHGPGLALAGPATDQFVPLIEERRATDFIEFIGNVGTPIVPVADPGGTTTFAAALETTTHGMVGDAAIRSFLAAANFLPGQSWINIKNQIETALGIDIDAQIDTSTFDDNALATAFDNMILKTRDGARSFVASVLSAISRAEDFLYIETPALDALTVQGANDGVISEILKRLTSRPGLQVILCVPEKFLPNQTAKTEELRKAGIAGALKDLNEAAADRVVLFSPISGPGRAGHLAATSIVVDDALLLTGSTHLWRRGLTFDSSIATGLFDENVVFGRPAAIRAARLQLLANALGLPLGFLPDDPDDCLLAVKAINAAGGLGRVQLAVYPQKEDTTSASDLNIWNPDGRPGIVSDWLLFFAALAGDDAIAFNNAIR